MEISKILNQFPKANFPDERFESSIEYIENFNNQNAIADKYLNRYMDIEIESLLESLETELFENKDISKEKQLNKNLYGFIYTAEVLPFMFY